MTESISFPTQGELVTYAFKAFGLLPTKYDRNSEFRDKAKTFQKLLSRLKDEEGQLTKNFEKALATFDERLSEYLEDKQARNIILGVLADLYREYNNTIIEEGTYRPKNDTLLYFLFTRATSALVEAVTFHSLRHQKLSGDDLVLHMDLFLPDIYSEGETTWPMAKVIRWIYSEADCSQIQFHTPGGTAEAENPMLQNLENAGNWVRDEAFPSLSSLLVNFQSSLALQEGIRKIPESLSSSMELRLTLARISTVVYKDIVTVYGVGILEKLTASVRLYFTAIADEVKEFRNELKQEFKTDDLSQLRDPIWQSACSQYANFFLLKKQKALETLQKLYAGDPDNPFKPVVIEKVASDIGQYPVVTRMDQMLFSSAWFPSPEFECLLNRGFELKQDTRTTESDVDRFEQELSAANMEEQLAWLGPWLRAVCLYRAERFADAFEHSERAFTLGKYRAGRHQYRLVNQYMELCAKTDRRLRFKQALDWANYAGIEVRWIRSEEQSKDQIDFAFEILSKAIYPIL
jgi:antibiotic biosynthesis monooxygenase (ABM) superfamily enzyme